MFDLFQNEKDLRVAWLVECDNKELYLTRSGEGCKHLDEKYKKTEYTATAIPKRIFDELENSIMFVVDLKGLKQGRLI